ncbi:hypothetical protein B0A49_04482 [Cryomyces minteri]|uniref:SGNH hydrolase-type esterase domain-containing protein n=1 Tax=Cryomyces minteri TaxID=331657 RepID=A0A4U0WX91_9PEZI|nr:hypothetical protein B0A49_04482 [Cryomyces minteri]
MSTITSFVLALLAMPAALAIPAPDPKPTWGWTSTTEPSTTKAHETSDSITATSAVSTASSASCEKHWRGWHNVQKFFAFGDSYTTVSFNPNSTQPNPANPIGNPPFPGYTSSNGPNWVDFLTATYNQSFVETYDLAYGGATVDSSLVAQYLPTVLDFRQQVNQEFLPYYENNSTVGWTSSNSLFAAFFGINDVGNSYGAQNATLNADIFVVYAHLVDQLYQAGACNFLFLNVPPVNLAPNTAQYGASAVALEGAAIADFNLRLQRLATSLMVTHPDTTVFQFDTSALFGQILNKPSSYPQTANIVNTTAYCAAYANGTPAKDTFNATCGVPVNEYFWLNSLHPLYTVHDAMASQIALLLE